MILKLLLSGIIVIGFGYMGYIVAEKQKDRLRQLSAFSDAFTMLEFNIKYMNYPIGEALEFASENCTGVVKKIFLETGRFIQRDYGSNPGEILNKKIDEYKKFLFL
ncbi:MAG: stage III sporulation protein AB, partial [Clostridia bacterium]|nr:stage III sporulation protein AB [Clostridia bacterium]